MLGVVVVRGDDGVLLGDDGVEAADTRSCVRALVLGVVVVRGAARSWVSEDL
ncbi:MAG: hypothetical protein ABIV51_08675 [Saprospiraceae bacterium]